MLTRKQRVEEKQLTKMAFFRQKKLNFEKNIKKTFRKAVFLSCGMIALHRLVFERSNVAGGT